ncbi:MAG: fibronectin type III-like domain-contianing protein [Bryobacteraceae bacterium]
MPGTPLYPFGYGLSYTQFQYSNLRIDLAQIDTEGHAHVSVDVENSGKRAGVETVQLFLHERFGPVSTTVKQLRGFERVAIEPGQKKTVTFTLTSEGLKLLDRDMRWVIAPGMFDLMIGKSSADIAIQGTLEVKGSRSLAGHR